MTPIIHPERVFRPGAGSSSGGGEALSWKVLASRVLFVSGYIPDQREDGEEFLGRNRRPKQTEMLKSLQLALGHVVTRQ